MSSPAENMTNEIRRSNAARFSDLSMTIIDAGYGAELLELLMIKDAPEKSYFSRTIKQTNQPKEQQ